MTGKADRLYWRVPAESKQRSGAERPEQVAAVVVLTLVALVSCWQFVAPGHPTTVDAWPHLVRTSIVADALRHGFQPFWSFMFYSGYPHLRFYSPLFYFLTGPVAAASSALFGVQVVLLVLHLLSILGMYLYLRSAFDPTAAALGALVYALVPWRVRHITSLANYPQAVLYVVLPFGFMVARRLVRRPGPQSAAVLGLMAGVAVMAHFVYAAAVLVIVAAYLLIVERQSRAGSVLRHSLVAAGLAAGLSASLLVPFFVEYKTHVYPSLKFAVSGPDPLVCLGFVSRSGGFVGGYLGLSNVGLAFCGLAALLSRRNTRRLGWLALAGIVSAVGLAFVGPRLGSGALTTGFGLLPERWFALLVFFFGILAAAAADFVRVRLSEPNWMRVGLLALLAGLVLADCLRFQFPVQRVSTQEMLAGREEQYRTVARQHPTKVLDVCVPNDVIDDVARNSVYPAMGFLYGGLPTPLGPHYHQFAPRSMAYVLPLVNLIAGDLGNPEIGVISPASVKAAALLGVSHLLLLPRQYVIETERGDEEAFLLKSGIEWDQSSLSAGLSIASGATGSGLVLVASAVRPMSAERLVPNRSFYVADDWKMLLDTLRVEPEANRLNFIPLSAAGRAEELPGLPAVVVLSTEMSHQVVRLDVVTSCDCYLRLALSYYPELRVRLNSKVVPFQETKDHFIVIRCPDGRHRIEVSSPLTPLRQGTILVSIVSLLGTLVMILLPFRSRIAAGRD